MKIRAFLLSAVMLLSAAACGTACGAAGGGTPSNGGAGGETYGTDGRTSIYDRELSADEALGIAKSIGSVVYEDLKCTSGKDLMESFCEKTSEGQVGSIVCVKYYSDSDDDGNSFLYYCFVDYDGAQYSLKVRDSASSEFETERTYSHLLHLTGSMPNSEVNAVMDEYVLTDDPSLTWEKMIQSLISSDLSVVESVDCYVICSEMISSDDAIASETTRSIEELRLLYPEYFEMSAFKGIEIYVWEMAEGAYYCGMMSGTNRNKEDEEIWALADRALTIDEAKLILSELGIDRSMCVVFPVVQPISSYQYGIDDAYVAKVNALF
ncbi:hypothetical protein SAMN02910456_02213 [Ruminococcaceae bacterium YRB3002]|nr:hypothetical protein SAMN02910456_02213 [Ruminococcaceae bacterium YRB3002]